MNSTISTILDREDFTRQNLSLLLQSQGADRDYILRRAAEVKEKYVGNKVYFRGLIELTNCCGKNCYYCGIRAGNRNVERYMVAGDEALDAAKYAFEHKFGSVVMQSGERLDKSYIKTVARLIEQIKEMSGGQLGITLSMGEQTAETYRRWFESGAHRYLLRIETSNRDLYYKLHPHNKRHDYENRLKCIKMLRKTGYNVGSGVMIGLPFQTFDDLAGDLLFMKDFDLDMVGMGPYIEHHDTPLYKFRDTLMVPHERFELSILMVALLRILTKDINIAATTAMQTLHPEGREKALQAGANIIMPNITPVKYREGYLLYNNKPGLTEQTDEIMRKLEKQILAAGCTLGYGEWGDSRHFAARKELK